MTIVELEQEVGSSHGSIHAILSDDLKMRRVSAKFVPRQLTMDQMECCMMVAGDLFEKSTENPTFLTKIVTGDKSWVFAYDLETKMQSAEWHTALSPRPKKSCLVKSKEKVMLIAFFDIDGVVHHKFTPPGQTVNGRFYVQVLQRLRDAVQWKWCDKWHKTHRATHRLLCSNPSPRKAFLSSPNHHTLQISLRVTFGCSLL